MKQFSYGASHRLAYLRVKLFHVSYYRNFCIALLATTALSACIPVAPPAEQTGSTHMGSKTMQQPADNKTTTPSPMTPQEAAAVARLQWLNNADPVADAHNEINKARFQVRKPVLMVFAQRGLSYPGLNSTQLASIRRKVNDKIVEGSGDVIYGQTHHMLRKKLRVYAVNYNQSILAALQ